MSYNIVQQSKMLALLTETAVDLVGIAPTEDILLKHIVVHLFIRGHLASDFKMRLNVYHGDGSLMMRSNPVNNLDIERTGDFYCELRFDFPLEGNLLSLNKSHRVEFEIYDGYTQDITNNVNIMLAPFGDQAWLGSGYFEPQWAAQLTPRLSILTDVINPASSEKFVLVRIKGGRLITPNSFYLPYGPSHWLYTVNLEPGLEITDFLFENGGTTVTTYKSDEPIVPNPLDYTENERHWYYNKTTGLFQYYSDIEITNSGIYGIIEYALYFTNHRGRYFRSTPDSGVLSDPKVYWEPRLSDDVEVSFTQQNNLQGLLSISTSSIQLKNHDRALNDFFSEYDCFNNREVKAWRGQGENFTFLFQGTIRSVTINDETVEFGVDDMLSVLDKTYDDNKLKYFGSISAFMLAKDQNRIIPRTYGRVGPWDLSWYWYSAYPGVTTQMLYGISGKMPEAACVSYNPVLATSANRTWSCGFGPASVATQNLPVTSHSSVSRYGGTASRFNMNMAGVTAATGVTDLRDLFAVGDTIKQGTQYGIIAEVTSSQIFIWPYNSSFTTADITRSKVAVVIERSGVQAFPVALRDYTVSIGVNGDVILAFVNNFEATVGLTTPLDPANDRVYFRLWTDQDTSASKFLYEQLTSFGGSLSGVFSVPVGGFAPDQVPEAWPDPQLSFSIPFAGASDFPTWREIFGKVLKSAMSFVYFDNNGYLRYKSFLDGIYDSPENVSGVNPETALDEDRSANFSVQMDLYDLYAGVNFQWTHNPAWWVSDTLIADEALAPVRALYKTNKLYEVESLVSANAPSTQAFLQEFMALVVGRTAIYQLDGFNDHFGIFIGDDIRVKRGKIIGRENSQMLRVISLNKGVNNISMGLVDLKKFPTL